MLRGLRFCLALLGASAVGIALSIFLLGAEATAAMGERVFGWVAGGAGPAGEHWPATMDSELRFYAALWGAYGIVALRTAWKLPQTLDQVPWLIGVFFAGGVGRVLSRLSIGAPHPFFTALMAIELVLPLMMLGLWLGVRRTVL